MVGSDYLLIVLLPFLLGKMPYFLVVYHHMGSFVRNLELHYVGKEIHASHDMDLNRWSYLVALKLVRKSLGYKELITILWKEACIMVNREVKRSCLALGCPRIK